MKPLPGGARSMAVALAVVLAACGTPATPTSSPSVTSAASTSPIPSSSDGGVPPNGSPIPAAGHELYGFVPYWEMDGTIAQHIADTPLSTVALFSVTNTSRGTINTTQNGYKRITGAVGLAMIAAAHKRGTRVELVFTSFGAARNRKLFGDANLQALTIRSLVALVGSLGIDGVNVDVEGLDITLAGSFGSFVGQLRQAVTAADSGDTVSVATGAGPTGAAMAAAALASGADRVFLMGYDYRTATSDPGATSPVARADDGRSLSWSLDLYSAAGIPPERLLLGLPLYGVSWPVAGPVIGAPATGRGTTWILRQHLDLLTNAAAIPQVDPLEAVSVFFLGSDGSLVAPSIDPAAPVSPSTTSWTAVYVDTPDTLATKLALGESRGLVGAGFWAIGYERGLPGYTDLMSRYVAGQVPAG